MEKKNRNAKWESFSPSKQRTYKRVQTRRIIFDAFLLVYIAAFLLTVKWGYGKLINWVERIEAADAQPNIRRDEVFQDLFADPDWEALYALAGEEDTAYEGAAAYAAFMEKLVGDNELTFVETSAGLSGGKKFIVKSDGTKVAEFTLKNFNPDDEHNPDWQLDQVFLFYTRQESLTIFTIPGHTVYINGVPLDAQAHLIATTHMLVEEYLPEDLHGYRDMTLRLEGLLVQPEVTIQDENGAFMEVVYDPTLNLYTEVLAEPDSITADQETIVIGAAQAYGKYMINAKNPQLTDFYDKNGQAYQDIIAFQDRWTVQNYKSFDFADISVSKYYQYSETYFSARVSMTLNVTRNDGSIKPFSLETTFFVRQSAEGKWLVETMTNVDVQVAIQMVQLVYMNGSKVVDTQWVEADTNMITLPEITVPNGKELLGWYTKTVDGLDVSYSLVFRPNETGMIILPEGYVLTPMVLYAQFQ